MISRLRLLGLQRLAIVLDARQRRTGVGSGADGNGGSDVSCDGACAPGPCAGR